MKLNVGGIDRVLRISLGALLIVAALMDVVGVWGWIGVVPLLTGLVNFCPLYTAFNFSSRKS
jgi:membrane-bound ClpP family serine protease